MSRIRVAVIGLGAISRTAHLPLIARNAEQFELAALVDLSAERAAGVAARHGVPGSACFRSAAELAEAVEAGRLAVDAAILATAGSHGADTLRLVQAGIRVLAEKPLSYSLAELDALRDAAGSRGIDLADWVRVGYMKEYDPAVARARELLDGVELRAVRVEVMHPLDGAQLAFAHLPAPPADVSGDALAAATATTAAVVDGAVGAELPARLRTLYTNVILGSIVHDIGVLRQLTGGLGEVRIAEHWGARMPGSLHLRGRLARDETPWSIDWHYIDGYPQYRETITFHHEHGTIELEFGVPYVLNLPTVLRVTSAEPGLGATVSESRWMQEEAFENELQALAALVRGERPAGASVDEAEADVRTGQRMLRALARSEDVPLDSRSEAGAAMYIQN
ncbi:Gfo/Idh/MocA family protein [Agromyces silvae]|uniref:Gfo/Idh/MocA family protein n=1 Tax=Agromyces silvae TaxID=3388266 RepID=UPI00280C28C0|nr:Gfo/Idh/MocA family oxidoreductase [Agromyces protaetiae]